jgi:hypothetical protein
MAIASIVVSGILNDYMHCMSRSTLRAAIPDLFDYVPAGPSRRAEPARARVPASLPELSSLPDLRLARLLIEVSRELEQRTRGKRDSASQTELDLALQEAARTLEALLPKQEKRAKRSRAADTTVPLQEAKRKAIRTALQAGVSPGQVAKHFGVPLSAVREALGRAK